MQPFTQHKHELHNKTRIKIRKGTKDPRTGAKGLGGQRLANFRSKITKPNDQLRQGCRHEIELQTSSKSYTELKVFEKEQVSAIDKFSRFRQNKNNSRHSNQLVSDAEDERKLRKVLKKRWRRSRRASERRRAWLFVGSLALRRGLGLLRGLGLRGGFGAAT